MSTATIRISSSARDRLKDLAAKTGKPMQAVLEEALEHYRRRRFLEDVNAAYDDLRADPPRWSEVAEERAEWDMTLGDGLEDD